MNLFVLPSWREGFPRSPMEAAAMGKALILSDIPGCHEIARDGVEAVFVRPRDPSGLARVMLDLLHDPDRRSRMGAAARATAASRFDEQRVAETVSVATRRVPSPSSMDKR